MKVEQTLGKKLRAIKIQSRRVEIIVLACNFPGNFSCATRKFLTKLHSLKAPLGVKLELSGVFSNVGSFNKADFFYLIYTDKIGCDCLRIRPLSFDNKSDEGTHIDKKK